MLIIAKKNNLLNFKFSKDKYNETKKTKSLLS